MSSLLVLSLLQGLGVEKTSLPSVPHTLSLPVPSQAGAGLDHSTPALNSTHASQRPYHRPEPDRCFNTGLNEQPHCRNTEGSGNSGLGNGGKLHQKELALRDG